MARTDVKCPRCGEVYTEQDLADIDPYRFWQMGCGPVLGTVCDGGSDSLAAAYERMLR